jgi:hypothetical protein
MQNFSLGTEFLCSLDLQKPQSIGSGLASIPDDQMCRTQFHSFPRVMKHKNLILDRQGRAIPSEAENPDGSFCFPLIHS